MSKTEPRILTTDDWSKIEAHLREKRRLAAEIDEPVIVGPGEYVLISSGSDPRPDHAGLKDPYSRVFIHGEADHYHGMGPLKGQRVYLSCAGAHLLNAEEYDEANAKYGPALSYRIDADQGIAQNHVMRFVVEAELAFDKYDNSKYNNRRISGRIDGEMFAFRPSTHAEYTKIFKMTSKCAKEVSSGSVLDQVDRPKPIIITAAALRSGMK